MSSKTPHEEMIQIIQDCIKTSAFQTARECLAVYKNTFGNDDFYEACLLSLINLDGPLVSLICLHAEDSDIDTYLASQSYRNIEVFSPSSDAWESEIATYINNTASQYVCFYEPGQAYDNARISILANMMESMPDADGILCCRNFLDASGTVIAHPDFAYQDALDGKYFEGRQLIAYSIANHVNLYGNLSTLFLSARYLKQQAVISQTSIASMRTLSFLYQLLLPAKIAYTYCPLVSTVLQPIDGTPDLKQDYEAYLNTLVYAAILPRMLLNSTPQTPPAGSIRRDITFFYTDKGEYYNLKPIADEAERRGYQVTFTENLTQQAEIGIYCQHICHPEHSKFSLILLHDLAQGHNRWPNIWELERWNKFDVGIVPGKSWANLWSQCACQYYANPRCGVFEFGYPKSDLIDSTDLKKRVQELRQELHLKYDTSILYAPSWENDSKEDDFISALASLKANLLIKQAHWSQEYANIIENIRQMRALHEGNFDNVYYIEPEESIMVALALCDFVVSDESSVMAEASMFGKPSIAITDWLIPDTTPSRLASVPFDYVIKCQKAQLREYAEKLLYNPDFYRDTLQKGQFIFSNSGNCCKDIMDAIEYFTADDHMGDTPDFLSKQLSSIYQRCSLWN